MTSSLNNAAVFLTQTLFSIYTMAVLLRLILQWHHVSSLNPIAQFLLTITEPVLYKVRRFIPRTRIIDVPLLIYLFCLVIIKIILLSLLSVGAMPNIIGVFVWAAASIFDQLINLFFYCILAVVIMSWINPGQSNPIVDLLYVITNPMMRPIQKVVPLISGFDLSPLVAILGLQLISMIISTPLNQFAMQLSW